MITNDRLTLVGNRDWLLRFDHTGAALSRAGA